MGVAGLWTVLQPCARPIKIETLNKKRLAIDASIWIYQFLKAVRDKEGNALRNSHIVGFFRRICKLLFVGIKPVFVFDGGAPLLKRETIGNRKARREGRREDAIRTAGKLLGVQMRRRAEEGEKKRREERDRDKAVVRAEEEEELPENLVYVDELQMTPQERKKNRGFRKTDAYHLPELDVGLEEMGGPDDPRVMSHEELKEYARQFHTGDVSVYDFSKIDFNSPFFLSLPAGDQYNILNAARLRSRLRMGYSKEQLENMFPDRMEFSKFQIERVAERNELTQRLMNINGMNGLDAMLGFNGSNRVAGEKGKEYVLVKNEGVEGGWALGVVSNKMEEGQRNKPIDVETYGKEPATQEDDAEWEDEGFEDVPIEGLNRLPKLPPRTNLIDGVLGASSQEQQLDQGIRPDIDVMVDDDDDETNPLFLPQEAPENDDQQLDALFVDDAAAEDAEAEQLRKAIAMSLEQPEEEIATPEPFSSVRAGAEFDADLQAAMNRSRPAIHQHRRLPALTLSSNSREAKASAAGVSSSLDPTTEAPSLSAVPSPSQAATPRFQGPLPFESLDFGDSILGRKKKDGGKGQEKKASTRPVPPWFSRNRDIRDDNAAQKAFQAAQCGDGEEDDDEEMMEELEDGTTILEERVPRHETQEPITINTPPKEDTIEIASSSDNDDDDYEEATAGGFIQPVQAKAQTADRSNSTPIQQSAVGVPASEVGQSKKKVEESQSLEEKTSSTQNESDSEESVEWEESDFDDRKLAEAQSISLELEDTNMTDSPKARLQDPASRTSNKENTNQSSPLEDLFEEDQTLEALPVDEEEIYSDPDEADLMRQLAIEAEEHARFASTLNSNTNSHLQTAEDYERELKQLRTQQKKDRRDADEVSQVMIQECQQLLTLFGLPYVTAPMEAEAQCAELVSLGLVDGTVTDDSDIFLFGGTRVYKNMFNQSKFVECYLATDLEKEYSLTRHKLIQIAHLLGSDYTEGIPTVGPVTALEILSDFESLEEFAAWCLKVQLSQPLPPEEASNAFRKKFKRNAAKIMLPTVFPDKRVDHAYSNPEVDKDPSPFAWGVPDLDGLRQFLMATIGWSQERTDEVLVPVIKDMNRRENEGTQANITQFISGSVGVGIRQQAGGDNSGGGSSFAPRRRSEVRSKRMETALGRLKEKTKIGEGRKTANRYGQRQEDDDDLYGVSDTAMKEQAEASSTQNNTKSKTRAQPKASKKRAATERHRAASASTQSSDDEGHNDDKALSKRKRMRGAKAAVGKRKRRTATKSNAEWKK